MKINIRPTDTSVNINIRIPKHLKELSSSLLLNMGINQSQFIRDCLQYVVNHNSLPWQQNNSNQLLYKYSSIKHQILPILQAAYSGQVLITNDINQVCAVLDDLQLQSFRRLEELHNQGMTSIPHSTLNNHLLQLTSILRYNGNALQSSVSYPPIAGNQLRLLLDAIDSTISKNNL